MNRARNNRADLFRRLWREKPLGTACGIIILLLILVSIFADVLAPYDYTETHTSDILQGPSAKYLLGTDYVGRDFLSRLILGARLSLTVGLAATTLNVVVAVLIGGSSGFFGGKLDLAVQRFVDAWMAFPGLLLLLTVMSIVGRGMLQIIVVLGITGGIVGSRTVRGAVIDIKENAYFQAAASIGSAKWRTFIRHVLPNIAPVVIVIFTINIGGVIISEASLSFLGFGLPPSIPSWGAMLSREGRQFMEIAPWLAVARSVPDGRGVQPEHVRRCAARSARSAAARRRRPSRRARLAERGVVAAEDAGGDLELEDLVGALGDTAVPAWTLPSQSVYDVVIRGG